jgi:tetratricopeptide (TPR) repeat protein
MTHAVWLLLLGLAANAPAVEMTETAHAREAFDAGAYIEAIKRSSAAIEDGRLDVGLYEINIESLLATGDYAKAGEQLAKAERWFGGNPRLYLLAKTVHEMNGAPEKARAVQKMNYRAGYSYGLSVRDSKDLVAFGRLMLLNSQEPKKVMNEVYKRALDMNEEGLPEVYAAMGDLALEKHDYALAAKQYQAGLKKFPGHTDLHVGLARAFMPSDPEEFARHIQAVLEKNTNHTAALLMLVEQHIDFEMYDKAQTAIDQVLSVNPNHPIAWAYQYVLDDLAHEPDAAEASLANARKKWENNPAVDFAIARKFSRKRRFEESVTHLRRAAENDPTFLPARSLLAQDLLRLGHEDEAWAMIEELQELDAYDVVLFNLLSLSDRLKGYRTLTNQHFVVRMEAREAELLGQEALDFLEEAYQVLNTKYGLELDRPVLVEFFREQQDFAVRTLGVPGGLGLLGACFGSLITMNSPGSLGAFENNWKAVLWHEYCHVVTLTATGNKMPRWLSEGISVFEEWERDPSWGQRMTPTFRRMVLQDDQLFRISELSQAFLKPRSETHFMFGYYESALVVKHIVDTYGFEAIRGILNDLATGMPMNEALAKHTKPMEALETDFAAFIRNLATEHGSDLNWEMPPSALVETWKLADFQDWLVRYPDNFYGLYEVALAAVEAQNFDEAEKILLRMRDAYPDYVDGGNVYDLLAQVYQETGQAEKEIGVLEQMAARNASALPAFQRLLELQVANENWSAVMTNSVRITDIDPYQVATYRSLARAAEALEQPKQAIYAYERMLDLDTEDPAGAHYQLARLYRESQPEKAWRHVLDALTEAPRYPEAHQLFAELRKGTSNR